MAQTASWIASSVGARRRAAGGLPATAPSARRTIGIDERLAEQRGDGQHAGHRALEHADVLGHAGGDLVQDRGLWKLGLGVGGEPPQQRDPGAKVGAFELDLQPPAEAVAKPLGKPRERLRRTVAGEHDLLAGGVQRVEGVDELLLGALLALEHLDVVDQQRVELAVARLEELGPVAPQGADELAGEALGGGVVDRELADGFARR